MMPHLTSGNLSASRAQINHRAARAVTGRSMTVMEIPCSTTSLAPVLPECEIHGRSQVGPVRTRSLWRLSDNLSLRHCGEAPPRQLPNDAVYAAEISRG
jgi:hypothetical protein